MRNEFDVAAKIHGLINQHVNGYSTVNFKPQTGNKLIKQCLTVLQ